MVLDPPAWAKRLAKAQAGYLFLDELTTCPPAVQAAMLAVALDRTVGDLRLPDAVRVIAGANPADRAADGWEISPPLANRFCHVTYAPGVDEWLDGMTAGWASPPASRAIATDALRRASLVATVTGFVRTRPDLLHAFPDSAAGTGGPWPSRRVWDMLARALAHVRDEDHAATQAVVFGLVGEGAGMEYLTWRRDADLPDPEAVVEDPAPSRTAPHRLLRFHGPGLTCPSLGRTAAERAPAPARRRRSRSQSCSDQSWVKLLRLWRAG